MAKYIVAGGRGFIGSEIARQLLEDLHEVVVIDDDSKGYGDTNIKDLLENPDFEVAHIDLSDPHKDDEWLLREYVEESNSVINCAAKIGGIGYFHKIPATIIRDNNLINTTLLDTIKEVREGGGQQKYVYLSSSMVFESATKFPSAEVDLKETIIPISSYGFSKLTGEFFCKAYQQQYGVPYTIIRPFNATGPEKPDPNFVGFSHVIPDIICKILNGQGTYESPLEILGDGEQVRHYTDVKDIASAVICCLGSRMALNEDFNVSVERGHSVNQLVDIIWNVMRPNNKLHKKYVPGFPHDVKYRSPDILKFESTFNWKPGRIIEHTMPNIVESVKELLQ